MEFQEVEGTILGKESTTPIEVATIPFEEYLSVVPLKESSKVDLDFEGGEFALFPSIWPPPNTLFIQWTYTIDLDRELFSVNHKVHFSLSTIPDTWIREVNLILGEIDDGDDDDDVVLIPQAIDISYPKLAVDENYIQLYEKAKCSIFQVEESHTQLNLNSAYEGLCFELAKSFAEFIQPLFPAISSWGPGDVPFKELAFALLLLADRYSFSLLPSSSPDEEDYDMGVAYPSTSSFWFAGTFVYLTTHLKDDAVRKSAIGHVLELTKNCPRSNFTAFLFSIRDLVVIDISEEGVKHTETLPFCDVTSDSLTAVNNVGLLVMITYFTQSRTSLTNHRTQTPTSPSSLPYDILLNIVKYVDWETIITLSATSKLLRECVERLGPRLGNFQLLKYDAHSRDFLACRDGDDLVKIKIQHFNDGYDLSESLFIVKIRYPGVRQQAFIPPMSVNELTSGSANLNVGAAVGLTINSRIYHMLHIFE